jgi:hypothetical protein
MKVRKKKHNSITDFSPQLINVGASHWLVIVSSRNSKIVFVFDSLIHVEKADRARVKAIIAKHSVRLFGGASKRQVLQPMQRQSGSTDCGPFALTVMAQLVSSSNFHKLSTPAWTQQWTQDVGARLRQPAMRTALHQSLLEQDMAFYLQRVVLVKPARVAVAKAPVAAKPAKSAAPPRKRAATGKNGSKNKQAKLSAGASPGYTRKYQAEDKQTRAARMSGRADASEKKSDAGRKRRKRERFAQADNVCNWHVLIQVETMYIVVVV